MNQCVQAGRQEDWGLGLGVDVCERERQARAETEAVRHCKHGGKGRQRRMKERVQVMTASRPEGRRQERGMEEREGGRMMTMIVRRGG